MIHFLRLNKLISLIWWKRMRTNLHHLWKSKDKKLHKSKQKLNNTQDQKSERKLSKSIQSKKTSLLSWLTFTNNVLTQFTLLITLRVSCIIIKQLHWLGCWKDRERKKLKISTSILKCKKFIHCGLNMSFLRTSLEQIEAFITTNLQLSYHWNDQ